MLNKILKGTISILVSLSVLLTSTVLAVPFVPFNGPAHQPVMPVVNPVKGPAKAFSMESIESKISEIVNPTKKEQNQATHKVITRDDSGSCGGSCTYNFNEAEGKLTISGSGEMLQRPWASFSRNINSVVIEDGITSICEMAFYQCDSLSSVTISNSVISIGDFAFASCLGLPSINIPDSVASIGNGTFNDCSSLASINVDPNNKNYKSEDGVLFNKVGSNLISYPSKKQGSSYTIPNSVTSIGEWAFNYCEELTSVTIENNVSTIGDGAFIYCTNLNDVKYYGISDPGKSSKEVFEGCNSLTEVKVPVNYKDQTFCNKNVNKIDSGSCGDNCTYTFTAADGKLTISGSGDISIFPWSSYKNEIKSAVIKDGITSIGPSTFADCGILKSIKFSNTGTSIGAAAFSNCSSLESIKIPESVTTIGDGAFIYCTNLNDVKYYGISDPGKSSKEVFEGCNSLTEVKVPVSYKDQTFCNKNVNKIDSGSCGDNCTYTFTAADGNLTISGSGDISDSPWSSYKNEIKSVVIEDGITSIGVGAFVDCSALKSVNISNSVTSIKDGAFIGCSSLETILIPQSVTEIGTRAFFNCNRLVSIEIPQSVEKIGSGIFKGCLKLTDINVNPNNNYFSSQEGVFFDKKGTTLIQYPGGKGDDNYIIPETVTSLDSEAFSGCTELKSIDVDSNNQNYISKDGVLFDKEGTTLVICPGGRSGNYTIPEGVSSLGDYAFSYCSGLTDVTIPNTLESISYAAFEYCSGLTSIKIPSKVTSIGEWAFSTCSNLTSVEIPNSVTSIENNAFHACTNLTNVALDNNNQVSNFKSAFPYSNIKSITLGNNVDEIDSGTFSDCTSLTNVALNNNNQISNFTSAFPYSNIKSITLGNNVDEIASGAFSDCTNLTTVALDNDNQVSNFNSAFPYSNIKSIVLGSGIDKVVDDNSGALLKGCSNLTSIDVNSNNPYFSSKDGVLFNIDGSTLMQCPGGKAGNYAIPNNVTSINKEAFSGCTSLNNVTIPGNVKCINDHVFEGCTSLNYVEYDGISDPGKSSKEVFDGCNSLTEVKVPVNYNDESFCGKNIVQTGFCDDKSANCRWTLSEGNLTIFGSGNMPDWSSSSDVPWYNRRDDIKSVVIGDEITSICTDAFRYYNNLTSIEVGAKNKNYTSIGGVLFDKKGTTLIQYPGGKIGSYTIPDNVTEIGAHAFDGCLGLTSINIPNSVTSIDESAFQYCKLTSIDIPKGVSFIGNYAFSYCQNLSDVEYYGISDPGEFSLDAFVECNKLDTVKVPSNYANTTFCGKQVNKCSFSSSSDSSKISSSKSASSSQSVASKVGIIIGGIGGFVLSMIGGIASAVCLKKHGYCRCGNDKADKKAPSRGRIDSSNDERAPLMRNRRVPSIHDEDSDPSIPAVPPVIVIPDDSSVAVVPQIMAGGDSIKPLVRVEDRNASNIVNSSDEVAPPAVDKGSGSPFKREARSDDTANSTVSKSTPQIPNRVA